MSTRVKYIIIGSIFVVLTIISANELRVWVGVYQMQRDIDNGIEQQEIEAKQEMLNTMDEKCIDNPDFIYCNNN
ncbi:MAG: hypothetical protein WBV72_09665 [Nitrososphaeraceae archaeon]